MPHGRYRGGNSYATRRSGRGYCVCTVGRVLVGASCTVIASSGDRVRRTIEIIGLGPVPVRLEIELDTAVGIDLHSGRTGRLGRGDRRVEAPLERRGLATRHFRSHGIDCSMIFAIRAEIAPLSRARRAGCVA